METRGQGGTESSDWVWEQCNLLENCRLSKRRNQKIRLSCVIYNIAWVQHTAHCVGQSRCKHLLFLLISLKLWPSSFLFFSASVSTGIRNTHRMAASSPFTGIPTASTLSTNTTYDLTSPHSYSSITPRSSQITPYDDDDDDQIVWNVSDMSSEHEGVVLTKPRLTSVGDELLVQKTPVSATKSLEMQMSNLSLSSKVAAKASKKKAKKSKRSKKATASSVQDTTTNQQRHTKGSAGLVGDAYTSPKHSEILQVLIVPISPWNPRLIPPRQSQQSNI